MRKSPLLGEVGRDDNAGLSENKGMGCKFMTAVRELPSHWIKLNLGCNRNALDGWVNVDIQPLPGVDMVVDLGQRWPWDDGSIHYIRAFDVFEHLPDPINTMNEAWRVLGHGGLLEVLVPSTDGRGAFQDPTHVSYWNRNSFFYYSRKYFASLYPDRIKCDFNFATFDTSVDENGVIWTWALCRAAKGEGREPVVPREWFRALSAPNKMDRIIKGYRGHSMGTMPQS